MKSQKRLWLAVVFSLFSFGFVAQAAVTQITGAGATFPYPLYSKWFSEFQKENPDVQINYQSIGSGGGIKQFTEGTIFFGATDAPMNEEQLKALKTPALHIPTVLGAVVITYNLPGVEKGLKLTSDIVADMFLGKITKWNDARIVKLNPGVKLEGDVLVVHRADGSGTTNIFTDYLAKVSPAWKEKVGTGPAVNWPVGTGGKGNEGVTGALKLMKGSVGYVELIYAENNKLPYAYLQNGAGQFVEPSLKSVTAAAASAKVPDDFRVSITNATGKESYPISGFTYLLVNKTMADAVKGAKLVQFLKWALTKGQTYADKMHYAPLPEAVAKRANKAVDSISLKPQS